MNTRIALPVALPSLLLATLLAGCSDDEPVDSAAPAASAAPASSAPAAAPSSAAPSAKSSAAGGCPATVATLEKAFKANPKVAAAIVLGKGLKDVSCYEGWATAVAQPTNLEPATVLFKYDSAKKAWAAVSGGTDGVCRDTVPEDVATHLKGCQN
ncbi:hypothetical protein [Dactylosporangium darangshiense]|uniref:hypothetical protein n=1 Tax=Dactylosporangium darangshiense TaxID=579108 RepID=UPI0031E80642